jgi:hypothetical protein
MKRIVFAPGICQIVNAAAALAQERAQGKSGAEHEDVLVLYGSYPFSEMSRAMEQAARCVWDWRAVVWAQEVLVCHFPTRRFAPIARLVLREKLGPAADEIWVSKLGLEPAKLILQAYPESRVVLYEDGAEEFIPQEVLCGRSRLKGLKPSGWPGGLRREAGHWLQSPECLDLDGVCARDRRRVAVMYSYLAQHMPLPSYLAGVSVVRVAGEMLKERLQTLAPLLDAESSRQPGKPPEESVVLFLPQPFAVLFLTTEDEYALYRSAVMDILGKGHTILWKEHPRETTPLAPRLQKETGEERLKILRVRQQMPVECLVAGWDLAAVVSVSSTSLFYLKGLYGYPVFTAAARIGADRWLKRTDAELARLFVRTLPGLEQLPPVDG